MEAVIMIKLAMLHRSRWIIRSIIHNMASIHPKIPVMVIMLPIIQTMGLTSVTWVVLSVGLSLNLQKMLHFQ
tara:strand:- start:543 stop:758 length:216 start_codon:yes stop_codon:yes gene_type:complete